MKWCLKKHGRGSGCKGFAKGGLRKGSRGQGVLTEETGQLTFKFLRGGGGIVVVVRQKFTIRNTVLTQLHKMYALREKSQRKQQNVNGDYIFWNVRDLYSTLYFSNFSKSSVRRMNGFDNQKRLIKVTVTGEAFRYLCCLRSFP